MLFLWSIFSLGWAVEGLDVGIQSPMSLQELNQPWNVHIDHQFWIQPVVYSNGEWSSLPVSDVLLQRFSVHHRLNRDWSVHGEIPLIFVGSKEIYRAGNRSLGTRYHMQTGRWNGAVGLDILSKGGTSTGLVWSNRGLYPNIQLNRLGVDWLFDVQAGVYRMQDIHPNIHVLLQQNKSRSFGFGFTSIWLSDALWSSATAGWTQNLDSVSLALLCQVPVWQSVSFQGSLFELQVSYRPTKLRRNTDRDGDGIRDGSERGSDQCEDAPEDIDGYKDDDGCPDLDNDADGVNDDIDECPMFAEDIDGYKDDDGCPDPDNDQDNILDIVDRCPSKPETINQYQDLDGCPDQRSHPDFDRDGLWDDRDNCPFHPEDNDGVQDDDGCPDPDSMDEWKEVLNPNTEESTDDTDAEE